MSHQHEALKLVGLNIEASRHLLEVNSFLRAEKPDVVLMQEVTEPDLLDIARALGINYHFVAMGINSYEPRFGPYTGRFRWGLGILSKPPILTSSEHYYAGADNGIPNPPISVMSRLDDDTTRRMVSSATIEYDGQEFQFLNTHFTWAQDAQNPTRQQCVELDRLLSVLANLGEFTLGGDFNFRRGRPLWEQLALHYTDNIPPHITTTIDGNKHYAGDLQIVVDGLFTTPTYRAENVKVENGLSDHCAIIADITKVKS